MSDRRNILLVLFDSLSAHDLHLHLDDLPTLRRLMTEGLNFTNAYTCCPESSPSRASVLTGLDMAVHGLWTDGVTLSKRETTVPEAFAAQGYHTWHVGRRQLAGVAHWTTEHARRLEYHHFDWAHGPLHRSRQNAYLVWLQDTAPEDYDTIIPRQADPDNTELSSAQRQAMMALPNALSFNAWVGQQTCTRIGDAPFLGIAGFVVGQTLGAAPAPVEALDLQSLRQADTALAKILEAAPEDTAIVLTAARGSVREAKTPDAVQEAAIKVPLMIHTRGGRAKTVQGIVSTIDIARTCFDLAGIHPAPRLQGISLLSDPPRGWALSRMRNPGMPHQSALRSEQWKLIVTHDASGATFLYDLGTDPGEAHNLANAPEHQDKREAMVDLMIDARVALEDRLEPRIAKF